jgi:formylglycine-generating enzyme required for sulfatase activity
MLTFLSLVLACDAPGGDDDDSADTSAGDPVDADGDGFFAWPTETDPALADCDDDDPTVTPATERYVAPGGFVRGDDTLQWAAPARTLTLRGFCIDRHEVTNADFLALLVEREADGFSNADDAGRTLFDVYDDDDTYPERLRVSDGDWSIEEGYTEHPVVEVWNWSAEFYCGWRGKRLPTEAEWEKAGRGADDTRAWPWGDTAPDCGRANVAIRDDADVQAPCVGDTVPVGSYPDGASPYGALDLTGNVEEWVSDWFDPDYYAEAPDADPEGPSEGQVFDDGVGSYVARVGRGGNYLLAGDELRLSARIPEPEEGTSNGVGFRCARGLE